MPQSPQRSAVADAHFGSRVIVFYRDGVDSPSALAANTAVGATMIRPLTLGEAAVLSVPEGADVEEAIRRFKQQPGVVEAEPDRGVTILRR